MRVLTLLLCEIAAHFFSPPDLDAEGGSMLGPRGNSSLHTPSTSEKNIIHRNRNIQRKKISAGLEEDKLQSSVELFFSFFSKLQKL